MDKDAMFWFAYFTLQEYPGLTFSSLWDKLPVVSYTYSLIQTLYDLETGEFIYNDQGFYYVRN